MGFLDIRAWGMQLVDTLLRTHAELELQMAGQRSPNDLVVTIIIDLVIQYDSMNESCFATIPDSRVLLFSVNQSLKRTLENRRDVGWLHLIGK